MKSFNGDSVSAEMPHLSPHEVASLMLLAHAPVELAMGTFDMTTLRDAGFAELIAQELGKPKFFITRKGKAVLSVLSRWIARKDDPRPVCYV
jgi:hypothetical protein